MSKIKSILSAVAVSIVVGGVAIYAYFSTSIVNCDRLTQTGSSQALPALFSRDEIPVPKPTDWVDYGPVLEASPEGAWDFGWTGMSSIVKKNRTYHFYYVANDGYRSHDGEAARHRAIGVATSQDGIRFTKYKGNPVMTHSPFNGEEEGANSAGITLSTDGDFVMFYGAAIGPKGQINADGRVAVSTDGRHFRDIGMVLDHRPPFARFLPTVFQRRRVYGTVHRFLPKRFLASVLYGYGDEIFPVATFHHDANWYVYYVPNGGTAPRSLGVAWGPSYDSLPCSVKALDGSWSKPVSIWGNVIRLAPDKIALFVQRLWRPDTVVEVRTASPHAPYQLSEPIERYHIPNLAHGAVFLDAERRTWFMYYNTFDRFWNLKLAPAGTPDTTPPTAPKNLSSTAIRHDKVLLSWAPASDPDTGVVRYTIYRDGVQIGKTKDLTFSDSLLAELTRYRYAVAAVNLHGLEGPRAQSTVSTGADNNPPTIVSVTSSVNPVQVSVLFSKTMHATSAGNIANYSINNGVTVRNASLNADLRTVTLATSMHKENVTYTLTVKKVLDRASTANSIEADNRALYSYNRVPGLVAYWNFDQRGGAGARDLSGNRNDGVIHGAIRRHGLVGNALLFNGTNSYVVVPNSSSLANVTNGSFTLSAWVKPEDIPSSANGYGILLRVSGHPGYCFGLSYLADGEYQAQLITMPKWSFINLASARIEPNVWRHLTMVVDADAKELQLYVDGKPVIGSPKHYSGTLFNLNQAIGETHMGGEYYIGSTKPDRGAGSFFSRHFKGLIEEARIYNRALNTAEVQSLFELTESDLSRP